MPALSFAKELRTDCLLTPRSNSFLQSLRRLMSSLFRNVVGFCGTGSKSSYFIESCDGSSQCCFSQVKQIYPGQAVLFRVSSAASAKFIAPSRTVGVSVTCCISPLKYQLTNVKNVLTSTTSSR